MTLEIECKHCQATVEVDYSPGEPAKTYGPPERCHDGSPDDICPDKCPECSAELDLGDIAEKAAEIAADAELERAIQRDEDRREEGYL